MCSSCLCECDCDLWVPPDCAAEVLLGCRLPLLHQLRVPEGVSALGGVQTRVHVSVAGDWVYLRVFVLGVVCAFLVCVCVCERACVISCVFVRVRVRVFIFVFVVW